VLYGDKDSITFELKEVGLESGEDEKLLKQLANKIKKGGFTWLAGNPDNEVALKELGLEGYVDEDDEDSEKL